METLLEEKLSIDKTNWTPVKFGDVVFEPKESSKDPVADGIEYVVGLEHIVPENIHLRNSATLEEPTTFTKKFAVGDVLFGRRRAYLKKAARASFGGICSGDITVFRAKENLMPELLPFIVNNEKFFDHAIKHSAGGLSPRVKFKDLGNYEFLLPPKDQQAQLAELLWAMDEVTISKNNTLDKLLVLKASVSKKYFLPKRDTDGIITDKLEKVGNLATKITDGEHATPKRSESGILLLSARNVLNDKLDFDKVDYIERDEYERIKKRCHPELNDVLISCSGTIGRVSLVPDDLEFGLVRSVALIKPNKNLVDPNFLKHSLQSSYVQGRIDRIINKTAQPNLFLNQIKTLKIILPELHVQKKISSELEELGSRIVEINQNLFAGKSLLKSLINQIF